MTRRPAGPPNDCPAERGAFLVELMIALIVLTIGLLAVGRLFPAGTRSQLSSRMTSSANFFVQQKAEEVMNLPVADPGMSVGRHPAGTATENLGDTGAWKRFYQVDILPAPLASVRRITINVSWTFEGARSVIDTIYVRR